MQISTGKAIRYVFRNDTSITTMLIKGIVKVLL